MRRAPTFTSKDITTVYDALKGCSSQRIAGVLLGNAAPGPQGCHPVRDDALRLATRRIATLLRLFRQVGPNCEASGCLVMPWVPSHLARLSSMAWPDALGTRIVLPSSASYDEASRYLADILVSMSYV